MECPDSDKQGRVYWNALMVINKIVFTSPEAMVEFSGENIKPWRSSKPFELNKFIWKVSYDTFSPSSQVNKSLILQITQPRYAKNVK